MLMVLLRGAVFVRSIAGIVVFEESQGVFFPGVAVGDVVRQAEPRVIPVFILLFAVLEKEEGCKVENMVGGVEVIRSRCAARYPSPLRCALVPMVFADGKGGTGGAVVGGEPAGVVAVPPYRSANRDSLSIAAASGSG